MRARASRRLRLGPAHAGAPTAAGPPCAESPSPGPTSPAPVVAEDFDNYAYDLKVARLGPLKLIQGFGGREGQEELYDLVLDPG